MGIAAVAEELPAPSGEWLDAPWPRPALRIVGPRDHRAGPPPAAGAAAPRRGLDVAVRRRRRARALRRRRLVIGVAVVAALAAVLALPVQALGGSPASPRSIGAAPAGDTVYTVRPGDTLWSIAERFDHGGDPRPLAAVLARQTGSATVVPGERIAIP